MPSARRTLTLSLLAAGLAGVSPAAADFTIREVIVDGFAHRIALRVPDGYDPARAWPLVVFLHGSGECGSDGEKQTRAGLGPALAAHPDRWPCLVLMPQKPVEVEEWEEREALVLAAIADVQSAYRIDPDRVALTGMSQGGHGVWMIGARHPDLFSCLAPVCGYGRARTVASRVARLPVWAFHGLRDDVVDPEETRGIVAAIRHEKRKRGLDARTMRLTLYPEANHNSWDAAYGEPELPGWLLGQARSR